MKHNLLLRLVIGISGLAAVASCDTQNDSDNFVPSRDCIVSAAVLGNVTREMHCLSSKGQDSIYYTSVNGSYYPMAIDQVNRLIFNTDSLPKGCRADRIVFSTFNSSGTTAIKSLFTGQDTIYVPTDSTDFSREREVTVFSQSNTNRTYRIKVNVHREEGDSLIWHNVFTIHSGSPLSDNVDCHVLAQGEDLYIYGRPSDGSINLIKASRKHPDFNTAVTITPQGGDLDIHSIRYFKGAFYSLIGNKLHTSSDGVTWISVTTNQTSTFSALAGSSSDTLYATANGKVISTADGTNWTLSAIDSDAPLPVTRLQAAVLPSHLGANYEQVLIHGLTETGKPTVWTKTIDLTGEYTFPWTDLPRTDELGTYALPDLEYPALAVYDNAFVLCGLKNGLLQTPYLSRDGGRSWTQREFRSPLSLIGTTCYGMTVDEDGFVWIIPAGAGNVYKGRHNRVGWITTPNIYQRPVRP